MLGVEKVIWLPGDVTDTETDGHVDGYVSYVKPATVLCEVVADPQDPRYPIMAENRKVLEMETDARGRRFNLVPIVEAPRSAVPAARTATAAPTSISTSPTARSSHPPTELPRMRQALRRCGGPTRTDRS
jgi:agmatine/peptidylarginine deiminase